MLLAACERGRTRISVVTTLPIYSTLKCFQVPYKVTHATFSHCILPHPPIRHSQEPDVMCFTHDSPQQHVVM